MGHSQRRCIEHASQIQKNVFLIEYPERWRGLERTYHTISRRKNGPHLRKFPVVIFCEETHLISIFRAEDGFQFQQQCYFNKLKLVLDFFSPIEFSMSKKCVDYGMMAAYDDNVPIQQDKETSNK